MRAFLAVFAAACLAACSAAPTPQYIESGNPETLSEWGQIGLQGGALVLGANVTSYDLNTPLFTDYAGKLRTVWMEGGHAAVYSDSEVFDFPVGTVITKTFYYKKGNEPGHLEKTDGPLEGDNLGLDDYRLIETRVLARRADGWAALPYVWNEQQTEAYLKRTGDVKRLTLETAGGAEDFAYIVPNTNQCAGCHATDSTARNIQPIGPKARHLNRDHNYGEAAQNQMDYWFGNGLLAGVPQTAPANAVWTDTSRSVSDRARAYIDINCSHCHSETGPADTSGLHLTPDTPVGPHLGLCKTPIAAGRGTGNREFGIVPGNADRSIFAYRMASTDPGIMMPEVGRSLVHDEGVALIAEWINSLEGGCGT